MEWVLSTSAKQSSTLDVEAVTESKLVNWSPIQQPSHGEFNRWRKVSTSSKFTLVFFSAEGKRDWGLFRCASCFVRDKNFFHLIFLNSIEKRFFRCLEKRDELKHILSTTQTLLFGVTLDYWSNKFTSDSYITITLHHQIDAEMKLYILKTLLFNKAKTGGKSRYTQSEQ